MGSQLLSPNSEAAIWVRLMQAQKDELSSEAAEFLLLILARPTAGECRNWPNGRRLEH
jgi:hypothetical protein